MAGGGDLGAPGWVAPRPPAAAAAAAAEMYTAHYQLQNGPLPNCFAGGHYPSLPSAQYTMILC